MQDLPIDNIEVGKYLQNLMDRLLGTKKPNRFFRPRLIKELNSWGRSNCIKYIDHIVIMLLKDRIILSKAIEKFLLIHDSIGWTTENKNTEAVLKDGAKHIVYFITNRNLNFYIATKQNNSECKYINELNTNVKKIISNIPSTISAVVGLTIAKAIGLQAKVNHIRIFGYDNNKLLVYGSCEIKLGQQILLVNNESLAYLDGEYRTVTLTVLEQFVPKKRGRAKALPR